MCFIHLPPYEQSKHSSQAIMCAFGGYFWLTKNSYVYDPEHCYIRITCNVVFFEHISFFIQLLKLTATDLAFSMALMFSNLWFNPFTTLLLQAQNCPIHFYS